MSRMSPSARRSLTAAGALALAALVPTAPTAQAAAAPRLVIDTDFPDPDVVVADAVGTSLDSLLAVEDDWARVVDVTVVFAAVVVEFDPPEILLTWKPWMSTDDAFEKRSVACPTALSEQSSVPYNNIFIFFSPCASMANTFPFS